MLRYQVILWFCTVACSQLVVNVKNQGGEVLTESIVSNTSLDTVTLDVMQNDGTIITQLVDFKNAVQIFKVERLGEEELHEVQYQVFCFLTKFNKNEFISSDAMSKLRQKNPSAVRHPEEDRGIEIVQLDLLLNLEHAGLLSDHLYPMCSAAGASVFTRDEDLKSISKEIMKEYTSLLGATKSVPLYQLQKCRDVPLSEMWRPCLCQYQVCVGWYPCGLKYCKGKDSAGKVVSYRCGIKTCRKCRQFLYYSRQKKLCLWDDVQKHSELKLTNLLNTTSSETVEAPPDVAAAAPADGVNSVNQVDNVHALDKKKDNLVNHMEQG